MRKRFAVLLLLVSIALAMPLGAQPAAHSVTLSWTASSSAAGCVAPCTFGYNVYRGTAAGAENMAAPINSTPIAALTFKDTTISLGASPVTFFYVVQAVETVGTVTLVSGNSNEVSATFPGLPAAPVLSPVVTN
jgi:hypothetical protein